MSRNSRWYKHGVVTLLSFKTLPAAIFGAWPEMIRKPLGWPAAGNLIHSQPTTVLEDGRSYNAKRFQKLLEQFAPKCTT